jgi:hypothetical protein
MSDIGLYGSIYDQLRAYADRLDHALIALRSPEAHIIGKARIEIVDIFREISDEDSTNPATRLVTAILKHGLPSVSGEGIMLCKSLSEALQQRQPNSTELSQLEKVALILDKECSNTLARIKGKR